MADYIPESQIISNQIAKPGEFVYSDSGIPYVGLYHIINGKAFAGAVLNTFEVPIPLDQPPTNVMASIVNIAGFGTAAYAMAKQNINNAKNLIEKFIPSAQIQKSNEGSTPRTGKSTFTQKTNDPNKVIKEIKDPNLIATLRQDPLYVVVQIDFSSPNANQQIEDGNKQLPGLKTFVNL
jgi:hypothetical protein